jgi:hypothetical protein
MSLVSTYTYTRVHTATYLSGVVIGAFGDILSSLGLSPTSVNWEETEVAVIQWITEGSLREIQLIVERPDGLPEMTFEVPMRYTVTAAGDAQFVSYQASLARYLAKLRSLPRGCTYRLLAYYNGPHTSMPGWGPASGVSTDGMTSRSLGMIGAGPEATASLRYRYRR